MGTNFDFLDGTHVGKRSASGAFCWDCNTTLCKQGNKGVHYCESEWYDACPICHKKVNEEDKDWGAMGRELGFNKSKPKAKKGVKSCASFSWAVDPVRVFLKRKDTIIIDEYGRKHTLEEFKQILKECPIQFYDTIGVEFC